MSALKVYARELKLRLDRFYKVNSEVMPSHLVREPISLAEEKNKKHDERTLSAMLQGQVSILEAENRMLKGGNFSPIQLEQMG